jgi:hypothetical protein
LDGKSEVAKAVDEAVDLPGLGSFVEVIGAKVLGAKVLVESSILQHVIGSRQDRSGDGANRLFCSAPGS